MTRPLVRSGRDRRGVIVVKVTLLMIPMVGMLALTIDYGMLLKERTDLQCAADAAALAAVRELVPDPSGIQQTATVRSMARQYGAANIKNIVQFQIHDADIEIGRFDPATIYTSLSLLNDGTLDTVRVTVRRDASANSPVQLMFARVLGYTDADLIATATAVLQRATHLHVGDGVLPFGVSDVTWNNTAFGQTFRIYNDGKIQNSSGQTIPGNWGTVDIGNTDNSTSELSDQIRNGLRQSDLDALKNDGRIPTNQYIETAVPLTVQGDTGLSAGLKLAMDDVVGQFRFVPVYDQVSDNGNNAQYDVIGWGVVKVIGSNFAGNKNTYVELEKTFAYVSKLTPQRNLANTSGIIAGAFTTPVLVE